ncbi:MAG TPA: hypothetical protein VGP96_09135 [Candidatus Dormibacteraeota bacterium]|nr:hypothetical protein [Candidatus Dormibacteraeota bacterium]
MTEHEPWWEDVVGDLVEILLELGEAGCARRTLDVYCTTPPEQRWPVSARVELRCRGLLSAAAGDLPGALTQLDAAVSGLDAAWSVDLARALLARGSLLRLLGRTWEARFDLKRALAIFTRHGLSTWRAAVLRAVAATVAAEAATGTLPAADRIVAELTGGHWSDHEIAVRLQLSLLAVERELGAPSLGLPVAESL